MENSINWSKYTYDRMHFESDVHLSFKSNKISRLSYINFFF